MNRVVWGLDDTRLTSRGLAVAIDPATWLTRPQGLSTADLAEPDIQVLDNTILVRSAHGFSTDLLLSDLAECSIGTREVWGAHGYQGTWLLSLTDSLSADGFYGTYQRATAALGLGEGLELHLSPFAPRMIQGQAAQRIWPTPTYPAGSHPHILFQFQAVPAPAAAAAQVPLRLGVNFGGSWQLVVNAAGQGQLFEQVGEECPLRVQGPLFRAPLWQRDLRLTVLPLGRRKVHVQSNDGLSLVYATPTPITTPGPPERIYPFGPGAPAVWCDGASFYAVWGPAQFAAQDGGSLALFKGSLFDLGFDAEGLQVRVDSDTRENTSIITWLEGYSGDLTSAGRYVRPCVLLTTNPEQRQSPFVYSVSVIGTPGMASSAMSSSLDLSGEWETITAENSLDDLSNQVEIALVPDAAVASLSPQLQRLAGLDLDDTPALRAYLTPQIGTNGRYDRMTLAGRGRLQRLENSLFDGEETFAALVHTEAMRQLLTGAGLAEGPDFTITEDASDAPVVMPERDGGDHDPTVPDLGTNRREYSAYICQAVSGWRLTERADGSLLYAAPATTNHGTWVEFLSADEPQTRWILADSWQEDRQPERFRNELWVVGESANGDPLLGVYLNKGSQTDPAAADYVGERRLLIYIDPSLTTEDQVSRALDLLVEDVGWDKRRARFRSVFDPEVKTGDLLDARGVTWLVSGRKAEITGPDYTAWADYSLEEYHAPDE